MIYSIITGGSSGLGFEIAKELIKNNKNIIIIGRDEIKLENAYKSLSMLKQEADIKYFSFDISNLKQVDNFYNELNIKEIEVEFLFNNAGRGYYGSLENLTEADISSVIASNLTGLINMTSRAVKHMKTLDISCRVCSILSTAALNGKKMETIYNAAKFGAKGFLEAVKDEISGSNIEVQTFFPGGMNTPFWDIVDSNYDFSTFMSPSDVANQIVELALNKKMLVSDVVLNRRK